MFAWLKRWRAGDPALPIPVSHTADTPIRTAAEDLLSRRAIAGRIADMLAAPGAREGRVFAIRGRWGGGKSSLKNLVVEALEKQEAPPPHLEFNPWQWGDGDSIARAMFQQMASRLGGAHSPEAASRAKALRRYGDMLVGTSGSLAKSGDEKGIVGWLTAAALILGGLGVGFADVPVKTFAAIAIVLGGVILAIGKFLQWRGEDQSSAPLDSVRSDLEKRLGRLERPLIIFVDDIDRLDEQQIQMLFRQVKVNANLPNILFVLLFQPSIVEAALRPIAGSEGRDYLEKIVQANFDLPPVAHEKLIEIFGRLLNELVGHIATEENGFEQVRWGNVLIGAIQPFIRNLRDVRRLLSSIEIHLPLHQGQRVFEVNIIDYIALEALRVFEPEFLGEIADQERLLLQTNRSPLRNNDDNDRVVVNAMIERVREPHRAACRAMIRELFPSVGWTVDGMNYSGEDWIRSWYNAKRVCTHRHFGRYFQLQIPDGAVSESDFADFVDASADEAQLSAVIDKFREGGALASLVARLDESVDQLPLEHIDRLMPTIFRLGEELSQLPGSDGPFNSPFLSTWRAASWFMRRVEDRTERAHILKQALLGTQTLAVPSVLIGLELDAREKEDSEREPLMDADATEDLKQTWLSILESRADHDPALLDHDQLVSHLYRWREFAGEEAPRAWAERIGKDPGQRVKLLRRFLSVGQQTTYGDHVSKTIESYRREALEPFFDLDELRKWLAHLDRSSLGAEDARVLAILDRYLGAWKRGESTEP